VVRKVYIYIVFKRIFAFKEFRVKTRVRNHRLYRHQSYNLHHEMFLLRARLLHAVNAVNNFVLTTVCI
jgi:hypothetical protein